MVGLGSKAKTAVSSANVAVVVFGAKVDQKCTVGRGEDQGRYLGGLQRLLGEGLKIHCRL
jgi:hypothetical protein